MQVFNDLKPKEMISSHHGVTTLHANFQVDLAGLLSKYGFDHNLGTTDHILSNYLYSCLTNLKLFTIANSNLGK